MNITRQTCTWSHVAAPPVNGKQQRKMKVYVCEGDGLRRQRRGREGKRFILSILNNLYPPGSIAPQEHRSANPVAVPVGSRFGPGVAVKGGRQAR